MSDITILKEMLTDAVIVPLTENEHGKKRITLTENNAQIHYSVVIDGMPEEVIVIKTDAIPFPRPRIYFVTRKGNVNGRISRLWQTRGREKLSYSLR